MLRMFRTINGQVEQIQKPENGSWLCLSAPTDVEPRQRVHGNRHRPGRPARPSG